MVDRRRGPSRRQAVAIRERRVRGAVARSRVPAAVPDSVVVLPDTVGSVVDARRPVLVGARREVVVRWLRLPEPESEAEPKPSTVTVVAETPRPTVSLTKPLSLVKKPATQRLLLPAPAPVAAPFEGAPVEEPSAPVAAPATTDVFWPDEVDADAKSRRRLLMPLFLAAVVIAVVVLGLIRLDLGPGDAEPAASPSTALPATGQLEVEAELVADVVVVREFTQFGQDRPDPLVLRLPDVGALTGAAGSASLLVSNLEVKLDGLRASAVQDPTSPGTWRVTVPDGDAPTRMEVSYRLDGAVVESDQSSPGRVLALVGPLSSGASTGEASVGIKGAGILNVFCPGLPADQLLCATLLGDTWNATLPDPSSSFVLVQVDRG